MPSLTAFHFHQPNRRSAQLHKVQPPNDQDQDQLPHFSSYNQLDQCWNLFIFFVSNFPYMFLFLFFLVRSPTFLPHFWSWIILSCLLQQGFLSPFLIGKTLPRGRLFSVSTSHIIAVIFCIRAARQKLFRFSFPNEMINGSRQWICRWTCLSHSTPWMCRYITI